MLNKSLIIIDNKNGISGALMPFLSGDLADRRFDLIKFLNYDKIVSRLI
ncbi:MAG: hypothetical protein PHS62_01815 [Patescibacteria group bacterium]|nr:hypothetical protein [Patescibacteria group bacterium]